MPVIDELPFDGIPEPSAAPRYGARFVTALRVAAIVHGGDCRKGTHVAYVSHPLAVCSIAMAYGADEDEAIAALLHDVIEDVRPTDAAIATVRWFGDRVFSVVEHCTDGIPGTDGAKAPSTERKTAYLGRIGRADSSTLLVSASDKLHNARSIVADLRTDGEEVWRRFNVGKDDELRYYRGLVTAYLGNPGHHPELVAELDRVVAEMWRLAGRSHAGPPQPAVSS
jgi:(p)ppGpp synthase/HD superfamily hydrolase